MDITLELKPDARCYVTVSIETQFEMEGGWGDPLITNGSASLEVDSPSFGELEFDANGSVTFSETGLAEMSEEIDTFAGMNAEIINVSIALLGIEGQSLSDILSEMWTMIPGAEEIEIPPEMENIVIEELSCTKFSWSEPTLEAGLTTTLSGDVFEDEELRGELPINIEGSIDMSETSISLTIEVRGEKTVEEFTLEINLTAEDTTVKMVLTLDGYFKLPVVDGQVQWSLEMPEINIPDIPGLENFDLENLGELFGGYDIDFTLKVPSDASVGGLPPGYSQEDSDTYTWSDDNAADALDMVLTEGAQPDITYDYEAPPSEFPWLTVGVLVVVIVIIAAAVVVLRRR